MTSWSVGMDLNVFFFVISRLVKPLRKATFFTWILQLSGMWDLQAYGESRLHGLTFRSQLARIDVDRACLHTHICDSQIKKAETYKTIHVHNTYSTDASLTLGLQCIIHPVQLLTFFCHISLWTYLKKRFAWKFPNSTGTFFNSSCRFWSPGEWVCSMVARGENVRAEGKCARCCNKILWHLNSWSNGDSRDVSFLFFMLPFFNGASVTSGRSSSLPLPSTDEILFDLKEYKLSIYGCFIVQKSGFPLSDLPCLVRTASVLESQIESTVFGTKS